MSTQNLLSILRTASLRLKYPSISFPYAHGNHKVRLSLAGKGYVAIKIDGEYSGRIDFNPTTNTHDFKFYFCDVTLQNIIKEVYHDPSKELAVIGRKYNHCCFCGLELNNAISVELGYGPICADNYGLPYEIEI